LRREVFFLAYHLHWSPDDVLCLAIDQRWGYVRLLADQLERESEAIKKASRG
jgi:23S rRNA A1618 N6-methylase RlmF